ncbi:MAG: GWxTD domain-containing protein [Flavobacteriales bacterium]|nr:GWxTD domain-containing protein [Flavobacteriales bacterium]
MMKSKLLYLILAAGLMLTQCRTPARISHQNLSFIYQQDNQNIHPHFVTYHISDSLTRIFYKLNSSDLLYSKKGGDNHYIARFAFHCTLYDSYEYELIHDSTTIYLEHTGDNGISQRISGSFDLPVKDGRNYLLEIKCHDINRNEKVINYIDIKKEKPGNRQYFYLKSGENAQPLVRNYFALNEPFTLETSLKGIKELTVRYYQREFDLPAPPFSTAVSKSFNYSADSTFVLELDENGQLTTSLNKTGFYHFLMDSTSREGLTVYAFGDHFPKVTTVPSMLHPLRYLTTQQEYDHMENEANKQEAVDEFWRSSGGSDDKSRDLIRKYYTRVEQANDYFTSYLEGWKTDRGLVYVIFGQPNVIYKTSNSESWVYGEEHNALSMQFTFVKVNNPFTDNDYSMNRSPIYKNSWYRAVDTWRQGRIY